MENKESYEKDALQGPFILAPAGDKESFFAAVLAGADAVYCGLKAFSARMEAKNFSISELAVLKKIAMDRSIKLFIALNNELKPSEIKKVYHLLLRLVRDVQPDALIVQDLALIELAEQAGFKGELHLSTLANLSFPQGLKTAKELGFSQVVTPRELSIDELRLMSENLPEGLFLESFVHGALCYAVSGRCYWSSYLGGKSGLRGRCVQPCRRLYKRGGSTGRFFSMQDLGLDVLSPLLSDIPGLKYWKIEGRKKGPHYVYYTMTAYKSFRDEAGIAGSKKTALAFLEASLGRPFMHYGFLPQRPWHPIKVDSETASGLYLGRLKGSLKQGFFLSPRIMLLSGDLLRIGYEGEGSHLIVRIRRSVPKGGRFHLKPDLKARLSSGLSVFLVDRREEELVKEIRALDKLFQDTPAVSAKPADKPLLMPKPLKSPASVKNMSVSRSFSAMERGGETALWIDPRKALNLPLKNLPYIWHWLDPVIWPDESDLWGKRIEELLKKGAKRFVLNAPWQLAFFKDKRGLELWAGPFCNISNALAIKVLKDQGFSGVIVSPELSKEDFFSLPKESPLPLGVVLSAFWPLAISRVRVENYKESFLSPKKELLWVKAYGQNNWLFPDWLYDISSKKDLLLKAGYSFFIEIEEEMPKDIRPKQRPGLWNWDLRLL